MKRTTDAHHKFQRCLEATALVAASTLAGCGGGDSSSPPAPVTQQTLTCDDSLKTAFKPDSQTSVLLVKQFRKGDTTFPNAYGPGVQVTNDVCLVKLMVGPGNPGPSGAPSTSAGIGMEIWLPAAQNWNGRIHNVGNGGFGGTSESVLTMNSENSALPVSIAANEGAISATTDMGYRAAMPYLSGDFLMNPDGTINKTLWTDFSHRHLAEQAVKSIAMATAFYGKAPTRKYFEGGSTGGREALKIAQVYPTLYDGLAVSTPAIYWTGVFGSLSWPSFVSQRDLAGPMSNDQLDLVSNAAIKACDSVGGQHLGYILDPSSCRYDPTIDQTVLCTASGGTNASSSCVSTLQAAAINKMWYGPTFDGSAPSPSADIGWEVSNPTGLHKWYGYGRGTTLVQRAGPGNLPLFNMSQLALSLQNPTLGGLGFTNATGNGADGWKSISYSQYSNWMDRSNALQENFADINTQNPDLSAFKANGGKIVLNHGLNDESISPAQSINYYNKVAQTVGGLASIQNFFRFYLVPGLGHGEPNGTANPDAKNPVPTPQQLYKVVVDWVEKGIQPNDRIELPAISAGGGTAPICAYPKKRTYVGGDILVSASYNCS